MIIVGCDFHPSFQQVAMLDTETGATEEHKLMHTTGEAEGFYRKLASPAIVGIETVGNDQWFVQLLQKLGHEVCVGDAAHIRASYVRKQKTDRRDAKHTLQLLVEGRFPRIWIPDAEMRDHRQLLIHRHKLVQIRTRVKNELQHLMLNQECRKNRSSGVRRAGQRSRHYRWSHGHIDAETICSAYWLCWMVNWKPSTMR
jgi:transposase